MTSASFDDGFNERVKLLLLDKPLQSVPTSKLPRKCPEYIVGAFWWAFFVASTLALMVLVCLVVVTKFEGNESTRPIYVAQVIKQQEKTFVNDMKSNHKDLLSTLMESSSNVFFLRITHPLNWRASCSLESILTHSPDKNVFLLSFSEDNFDGVFEKKLRSEYANLMTLKVDGKQYFKDSMFDGEWQDDEVSLHKAALLTIWQFGGSVLSGDVVVTAQMPKGDCHTCLVSEDFISCPMQCAAYVYQMIVTLKNNPGSTIDEIVHSSVKEFCGNPVACPGVQRLPSSCSSPTLGCVYVKIPNEPSPSDWTWAAYQHYCPVTYSTFKFP